MELSVNFERSVSNEQSVSEKIVATGDVAFGSKTIVYSNIKDTNPPLVEYPPWPKTGPPSIEIVR